MVDIAQNKKRLFIAGAGGFGRELESWIYGNKEVLDTFEIIGFIDDNVEALNNYPSRLKVVGDFNYPFNASDYIVFAIANPEIKEKLYLKLKEKVKIYTYIDPSAKVGYKAKIGAGCVVLPNVIISTNVSLGNMVSVNIGTHVGHDAAIGDYCSLMANVDIGGETKINNNVYLGTNSAIIPRVKVTSNVVVGIGAIVFKSIKKKGTYVGNPASLL